MTRKWVIAIAIVLTLLGAFGYAYGNFVTAVVNERLVSERIFYPKSEAEGLYPDLAAYAGQQVRDGQSARQFADFYIKRNMEKISRDRSYAQVSAAYNLNPTDPQLAQLREALFKGQVSRAQLLNAYLWWQTAQIVRVVSVVLLICAVVMAVAALWAPRSIGSANVSAHKSPPRRSKEE